MPLYNGRSAEGMLEIGRGDIIVLVGADSSHLHDVGKAVTGQQLIVFEPNPDKRAALSGISGQSTQLTVVSNVTQLRDQLARHLVYTPGRRVALMSPPEFRNSHADVVEQAAAVVEQVVNWADMNHGTTLGRVDEWLEKLTVNAPFITKLPDITLLSGRLSRVPAIIVGAGPSIDESLEDIAFGSERGVVLAAASALGPMSNAGLKPHIVFATEARDESRQFIGEGLDAVFLAGASTGHPNHFQKWPGPKGMFHLYAWLSNLTGGQSVPTGGHVTSAAFSMAAIWDCDPIILVGQDLAHTGGRVYGSGRAGAEEAEGKDELEVRAIGGGRVRTTPVMHTYRLWYEEAVRIFQTRWPDKRFINATKAGSHIEGFEYTSIKEALGGHPCFVNGPGPILNALQDLPRPDTAKLAGDLEQSIGHIQEVMDSLKNDGPVAAHEKADGRGAAHFALTSLALPNADAVALKKTLSRMRAYIEKMRADFALSD